MKVLLVSHTYMVKANQKKLDELAAIPGVKLQVVVPLVWKEELHPVIAVQSPEDPGYSFLSLPTFLTGRLGKAIYHSLDLTIRKFRPDIIHTESGTRGLTTFQAALYKRLFAPRSKFITFTWSNLEKPMVFPLQFFERYNLKQTDHVICGNQDALTLLRSKGYKCPISVIPQLGIDTDFFRTRDGSVLRKQLNISQKAFVIGFIGRMVPEKGLMTLVEAAGRLKGDWTLLLIGRGPDRDIVLQRLESLGIADRVRWVDVVPHLELGKYYNAMNVLVSPSITTAVWKEQFGLVVAQAMASQVPVVGSLCGETPNLVGDAGLLFPEGDVSALIEHLCHLQLDSELCADLGMRGVKRIQENYTFNGIAKKNHQVWEEVLNGP